MARIWLPLGLVVLLILAIPGFVLFFLHVARADQAVNDWLGENFQLSYEFPLHWSLGFLLLLVPLAIILLYFFKLKRKPLQVPSTFLWRKSIEDLHVNALFQWLRENVLLLLQVLAVLVLIYSVLGLRFHGAATKGKHYILIIDNSASMASTDVKPNRFEWAKAEAIKVIDSTDDDSVGMVIVFNSKATTLQAYTNNRAKLREVVNTIQQTYRTTRIEDALILADSLANQVRSAEDLASRPQDEQPGQERAYVPPKGIPTEVYLFSDGGFPEPSEQTLSSLNSLVAGNTSALGNLKLHYHSAGIRGAEQVDNVGIVELNATRTTTLVGLTAFRVPQVFVVVRNYRPAETLVTLRLDLSVDGKVIHTDRKPVMLPAPKAANQEEAPGQPALEQARGTSFEFLLPPVDLRANAVVRVALEDVNDHFPLDDEAWLVIGMVRKANILRVGGSNPVLDAFLEQDATAKVATITRLAAGDLATERYQKLAHSGDFDLVIFDRCIPDKVADMPLANTLCIDRPPPPWRRAAQELNSPFLLITKAGKEHALLRHLASLWDLGVTQAFPFDPEKDTTTQQPQRSMTTLIEVGGGSPAVFTIAREVYTDLVLTFPLINDKGDLTTSWPLQPSFPLFLHNVLFVLGNVRDLGREPTVQPGEPMVLRPEAGVQQLTVTPPKGDPIRLQRGSRGDFVFAAAEQLGPYRVAYKDANGAEVERTFAVNLLDASESNIEPRGRFKIGTDEVEAGQERRQPYELWKWIALGALILLLVEWYIYNRRIYV